MSAYVYRIHDDDTGELLYIGASSNPRNRVRNGHRRREWWPANPRIELEEHPDRAAALVAETEAIRRERPPHNGSNNPDAGRWIKTPEVDAEIKKLVDLAPKLSAAQRDTIAALFAAPPNGAGT